MGVALKPKGCRSRVQPPIIYSYGGTPTGISQCPIGSGVPEDCNNCIIECLSQGYSEANVMMLFVKVFVSKEPNLYQKKTLVFQAPFLKELVDFD
jgi:hypothetical protein